MDEAKAHNGGEGSRLDGVEPSLSALERGQALGALAAEVGFDWETAVDALAKVREEVGELAEALEEHDADAVADELGDLLFAVANVARKAGVDAETAMEATNAKFRRRFAHIERVVAGSGRPFGDWTLDELEAVWRQAKAAEPSS